MTLRKFLALPMALALNAAPQVARAQLLPRPAGQLGAQINPRLTVAQGSGPNAPSSAPPQPSVATSTAQAPPSPAGNASDSPRDSRPLISIPGLTRYEPSANEIVQEALRYFRVHPDHIDRLRTASHLRALVPVIATGYRLDNNQSDNVSHQTLFEPKDIEARGAVRNDAATVGAVFDFRDLVFNPAEVQVYGLVGVQRDIMLEVTRTYYLRRQLLLRLAFRPPADPIALATLRLRVEEFTSVLDVLSGGWFSRTVEARYRRLR